MATTDKARHAFGNSENLESALQSNAIDAYDILFLDGDTAPKIGWVDKNNVVRLVDNEKIVVVEGESMPETGVTGKIYIFGENGYFWNGTGFVNLCKPTDVTELQTKISSLGEQMEQKVDIATVQGMIEEYSEVYNEIIEF